MWHISPYSKLDRLKCTGVLFDFCFRSFQTGAESHERWTKIAEETKKASSQLEDSERRLRDKAKEVSALQAELSELSERAQAAEKASANLQSEKEELEKRISLLRESTKTSSDEVKRLSGTLNLKDVEVESLRGDLASLSDQVCPFIILLFPLLLSR